MFINGVLVWLSFCLGAAGLAKAEPSMPFPRTFSYTYKPGQAIRPNEKLVLCNHTARTPGGAHAVLVSWFTGQLFWDDFGATKISYYVDGETEPSVSASIDMLTGNGPAPTTPTKDRKNIPWGNEMLGRVAIGGGAYSTVRIPFSESLLVVAEMYSQNASAPSRILYSLIRGLENYGPITLRSSGVQLSSRVRLKSFYISKTLLPIEWATLANITSGKGTILQVVQHVRSENAYCLEGTHWATVNSRGDKEEVQLSSGFEDYYLSGQYFDAGEFSTPLSGMESENAWLYPHALTAYRIHEADPVMFSAGITLRWQNGMKATGRLAAGKTQLESLVLAYVEQ
jgi:hypothetical protein|eukprot:g2529.t1